MIHTAEESVLTKLYITANVDGYIFFYAKVIPYFNECDIQVVLVSDSGHGNVRY